MQEYFETLGLQPGASKKEIKAAARRLMAQYHPDKNLGSEALEKAQKISEAYTWFKQNNYPTTWEELADKVSHSAAAATTNTQKTSMEDFFREVFGDANRTFDTPEELAKYAQLKINNEEYLGSLATGPTVDAQQSIAKAIEKDPSLLDRTSVQSVINFAIKCGSGVERSLLASLKEHGGGVIKDSHFTEGITRPLLVSIAPHITSKTFNRYLDSLKGSTSRAEQAAIKNALENNEKLLDKAAESKILKIANGANRPGDVAGILFRYAQDDDGAKNRINQQLRNLETIKPGLFDVFSEIIDKKTLIAFANQHSGDNYIVDDVRAILNRAIEANASLVDKNSVGALLQYANDDTSGFSKNLFEKGKGIISAKHFR